jgi:hypothetical protein
LTVDRLSLRSMEPCPRRHGSPHRRRGGARADGNLSAAARMLGTTRQTLRYRVKKYGIQTGDAD